MSERWHDEHSEHKGSALTSPASNAAMRPRGGGMSAASLKDARDESDVRKPPPGRLRRTLKGTRGPSPPPEALLPSPPVVVAVAVSAGASVGAAAAVGAGAGAKAMRAPVRPGTAMEARMQPSSECRSAQLPLGEGERAG